MATRRTYGDPCGIARALDLVGERWAILIVRELLLGSKRFTDLRAGLPNVSPDVLAQRVRELEVAGIVRRQKLPPPAASQVYELTEWGRELEPAILALGRWGSHAPFPAEHGELGVDATMVALRTLFDPAAAGDGALSIELRLGEYRFDAHIEGGRLTLTRGAAPDPDAVIESETGPLVAVLWHGLSLAEALHRGAIKIEGRQPSVERFLTFFPPPKPAEIRATR